MKKIIKPLTSDKILKWGTISTIVLLIITITYLLFLYFSLPPIIPIFNQLPWGTQRLGTKPEIFLPILIALFFFIGNVLLLTRIHEKAPLLSRILSVSTFLIMVLTFIFIIRTLLLIV